MTEKQVLEFAKNHELGFDSIEKSEDWNGYQVYHAYWEEYKNGYFGYPAYILVNGDEIRMCTVDESIRITRNRP